MNKGNNSVDNNTNNDAQQNEQKNVQQYNIYLEKQVQEQQDGKRLSTFLRQDMSLSGNALKKARMAGSIYCNGKIVFANYIVKSGDMISIEIPSDGGKAQIMGIDMALDIVYDDPYLVAVNKQPGLICHPLLDNDEQTIAHGLKYLYPDMGIHPISRLDRDTSGLVLYAKNSFAHYKMTQTHMQKQYIGVTVGRPKTASGIIELPIARADNSTIRREINASGKPSITKYETLYSNEEISVLSFLLITGRTHQIRVHSSFCGFPILHDTLYGKDSSYDKYLNRQALHSHTTSFIHPFTNKHIQITAQLPEDMSKLYRK